MLHRSGTHYPGSQRSSGFGAVLNWGLSLSSPLQELRGPGQVTRGRPHLGPCKIYQSGVRPLQGSGNAGSPGRKQLLVRRVLSVWLSLEANTGSECMWMTWSTKLRFLLSALSSLLWPPGQFPAL